MKLSPLFIVRPVRSMQLIESTTEPTTNNTMNVSVRNLPGFDIPTFDTVKTTYVGATNNLNTVEYWVGGPSGSKLATLTFTYAGGTPSTNDALVSQVNITRTNA
jgi:hypothetical protein